MPRRRSIDTETSLADNCPLHVVPTVHQTTPIASRACERSGYGAERAKKLDKLGGAVSGSRKNERSGARMGSRGAGSER